MKTAKFKAKYQTGDEVFFTDPNYGESSGTYTVQEVIIEDKEDQPIYILTNRWEPSIEAYESELS